VVVKAATSERAVTISQPPMDLLAHSLVALACGALLGGSVVLPRPEKYCAGSCDAASSSVTRAQKSTVVARSSLQ
jgi:hypothetical protein